VASGEPAGLTTSAERAVLCCRAHRRGPCVQAWSRATTGLRQDVSALLPSLSRPPLALSPSITRTASAFSWVLIAELCVRWAGWCLRLPVLMFGCLCVRRHMNRCITRQAVVAAAAAVATPTKAYRRLAWSSPPSRGDLRWHSRSCWSDRWAAHPCWFLWSCHSARPL
jgi:hypothetical protein